MQTAGGNVTPAGPVTLCQGQCQTFTATPDAGYCVCGWVTNFVEVTKTVGTPPKQRPYVGRTLRFSDIQNDGTVEAIFCPAPNPWGQGNITNSTAAFITPSSYVLSGTINPSGYGGSAWFQYGVTDAYDITDPVDLGSGSTNVVVSEVLTGLLPNTTYYYVLVTSNSDGYFDGGDQMFTTAAIGPTVSTGAVVAVGPTVLTDGVTIVESVLLSGCVNPNGSPVIAGFDWGTTTNYSDSTPTPPISLGPDTAPDSVTALLTNLEPGVTYHYQLWASNDVGMAVTPDQVFTTAGLVPMITNVTITSLTSTTATVSASVNPNGQDIVVWFNWGTTTNFGNTTPSMDLGNGSTNIVVSVTLGPLNSNTTYYAEVMATNATGMVVSPVLVFGNVTTDVTSPFWITSIARQSNNVLITWQTFGDSTNVVQVSPGGVGGRYSTNNFVNLSPMIFVPGTGVITTNYLDVGGATNKPARYYRVEVLVP